MDKELYDRYMHVYYNLYQVKAAHRKDMCRLLDNCAFLWREMSKESVTCRRKGRNTIKFNDLADQFLVAVETVEQYFTFAVLING